MQQVVRRTAGLLLALLAGGVLTACGSSSGAGGPGGAGGTGSPTPAAGPVQRPYNSATHAAMGFGSWFSADATDCGEPDFVLNGRLPQAMLDSYSCRQVMTPAEIAQHCKHGGWGDTVAPGTRPVVVSPTSRRITIAWNGGLICPGVPDRTQRGTFEVVVQKYADGWSVTSYKILTGPGAGASG